METSRTVEMAMGCMQHWPDQAAVQCHGCTPAQGCPRCSWPGAASEAFWGQLLARSSQRGVLGTAPGQSSQFLLVLTGLPEQPLNVCTSLGCVHSPWVCAQPLWPAALPSLLPARLPHASGPRHPVIAISGQDAIPADAIPLAASFISPHQQRGG